MFTHTLTKGGCGVSNSEIDVDALNPTEIKPTLMKKRIIVICLFFVHSSRIIHLMTCGTVNDLHFFSDVT